MATRAVLALGRLAACAGIAGAIKSATTDFERLPIIALWEDAASRPEVPHRVRVLFDGSAREKQLLREVAKERGYSLTGQDCNARYCWFSFLPHELR